MTVGICDWGIGGLGFYNLLRNERPDLDVLYVGDQGVPGYGLFDRASLTRRLEQVFRLFRGEGVSDVVVACNAASTVVPYLNVEGVTGYGIIGLYELLSGWSSSLPRKKRMATLKFWNCLNPLATVLIS